MEVSKQPDSKSCGIMVCNYAKLILNNISTLNDGKSKLNKHDVHQMKDNLAAELLSISEDINRHELCRKCSWKEPEDEETEIQ